MFNLLRRPTVTTSDLQEGLSKLGAAGQHVMVHASLRSFGDVEGGAAGLLLALTEVCATVSAPAFTYSTLLPTATSNIYTQFHPRLRVSRDIGRLPQQMVDSPHAWRSFHPALSFVAIGEQARAITERQSLEAPYAPVAALHDLDGLVLLLGVDHSSNTSIHYGEYLAGVPLLTRYVPLGGKVVETAFPNCSADFERLAPYLHGRSLTIGRSSVQAFRVREVVEAAAHLLTQQPEALLCNYAPCRCREVRRMVREQGLHPRAPIGPVAGPEAGARAPSLAANANGALLPRSG